jgi:hypothetical protein
MRPLRIKVTWLVAEKEHPTLEKLQTRVKLLVRAGPKTTLVQMKIKNAA